MSLRYPETIDGSKDFVRFEFYEYESPIKKGGGDTAKTIGTYTNTITSTKQSGNSIYLYMPNDIGSSFTGAWGGKNTTSLAQAALSAGAAGIGSALTTGDFRSALSQVKLFTNPTEVLSNGLKALGDDGIRYLAQSFANLPGLGANLNENDILQLSTGTILNPNTELLYGGPGLRTHGYTFKLIPQSRTEAQNVIEIVQEFQKACLPKAKSAFLGLEGRNFISVPPLCEVTFWKGSNEENEYLPKYKLSGITSVNVNFVTEGNYMSFKDGEPIGLQLTIGLTEAKLIFSDEIGKEAGKYR